MTTTIHGGMPEPERGRNGDLSAPFCEPSNKEWTYHVSVIKTTREQDSITQAISAIGEIIREFTTGERAYIGREIVNNFKSASLNHLAPDHRSSLSRLVGFAAYESKELRDLLLSDVKSQTTTHLEWGAVGAALAAKINLAEVPNREPYLSLITIGIERGRKQTVEELSGALRQSTRIDSVKAILSTDEKLVEALTNFVKSNNPHSAASSRLLLEILKGEITYKDSLGRSIAAFDITEEAKPISQQNSILNEYFNQHGMTVQSTYEAAFEGTRALFVCDNWGLESSGRIANELKEVCQKNRVTHILVAGLPVGTPWEDVAKKEGYEIKAAPCGAEIAAFGEDKEDILAATGEFYTTLAQEVKIIGIDADSSNYGGLSGELQRDKRVDQLKTLLADSDNKVLIFTPHSDVASDRLGGKTLRACVSQDYPRHFAAIYSESIGQISCFDDREITNFFHHFPREQSVGLQTTDSPIANWSIEGSITTYAEVAEFVIFRASRDDGSSQQFSAPVPFDELVLPGR